MMEKLNTDTIKQTIEFLDTTGFNFLFTNKLNHKETNEYFQLQQIKKHKNFIKTHNFNEQIIDLFGGINSFIKYPILQWNPEFMGATGYIDYITPKSMSAPIMKGIDSYNRPFVVLRMSVKYPSTSNKESNKESNTETETKKSKTYKGCCIFFQRHIECSGTWTSATNGYIPLVTESGYFMTNYKLVHKLLEENIQNLLNNKNEITTFDVRGNKKTIMAELY